MMEAKSAIYFGEEVLECPVCNKLPFYTFQGIEVHVRRVHDDKIKPVGEILKCGYRICCNYFVKTHPVKKYCCRAHSVDEGYYRRKEQRYIPWERKTKDKKQYMKDYYQRNKEKIDTRSREWSKNNPERKLATHRKWVKKNREHVNLYRRTYRFNKKMREKNEKTQDNH